MREYRTFKRTRIPKKKLINHLANNPALAIRELHNRSFYSYLQYMWPEVSAEEFQGNWHIKYMCDTLQELAESVAYSREKKDYTTPIPDVTFNVPPGSTKTTTVMIMFPSYCWTRWYWMEFICLSYSSGLSLESAETSRELIRSTRFKSIYPELEVKNDKDQKSNFQIIKNLPGQTGIKRPYKTGGSRYSTSVGGTVTGFHAHIILVDDPINPEQAVSPVQLQSANRWLSSTMPTRKIHKAISPTVMIMQRLHQNDPTGHQLAKKKKTKINHICLPAEIRNYPDAVKPKSLKVMYSEDGLLDPQRLSWDVINNLISDLGMYGAAGQLGQSPTPPEGGMFKVDNFRIVDQIPEHLEIIKIVRYWDKAGSEVKKGQSRGPAYTVGLKMAECSNGQFIILDVKRFQLSSEKRETEIKRTAQDDGYDVYIGIEQEPGSGGKESAENTVRNLSGFAVHVEPPQGDKVTRADPFSVQVNWGNVYMLRAEWNAILKDEFRFFPFGTYKDQVDAGSGAFRMLRSVKIAQVW